MLNSEECKEKEENKTKIENKQKVEKIATNKLVYKIDESSRRIIRNVFKYLQAKIAIPKQHTQQPQMFIKKELAKATGIGLSTIYKLDLNNDSPIIKETVKQTRKKRITDVSDEMKTKIHEIITEISKQEKPTVGMKALHERLKAEIDFKGSVSSLATIVKRLGFQYVHKSGFKYVKIKRKRSKKPNDKNLTTNQNSDSQSLFGQNSDNRNPKNQNSSVKNLTVQKSTRKITTDKNSTTQDSGHVHHNHAVQNPIHQNPADQNSAIYNPANQHFNNQYPSNPWRNSALQNLSTPHPYWQNSAYQNHPPTRNPHYH